LHIVGHARAVQIRDVVQRHAAAEEARHQRLQKAPFEFAPPLRRAQAQGREYLERERGVAPRAAIEFVGQRVGLAYTQRQSQHDVRSDAAQRGLDAFGDIVEDARHAGSSQTGP